MGCKPLFLVDHDMTLADTLGVFYRTYSHLAFKHSGIHVTLEEFLRGFCNDSLSEPLGVLREAFWSEFKKSYAARGRRELRPMPGAREFLEALRERGYVVVVVSGRGEPPVIERELSLLGLRELVDDVYTVGEDHFDKTSVFETIVRSRGGPCVVVGDYRLDLKSAVEAGCLPVGVTAGCKNPDSHRRAGARIVVEHLGEALGVIERIVGLACGDRC